MLVDVVSALLLTALVATSSGDAARVGELVRSAEEESAKGNAPAAAANLFRAAELADRTLHDYPLAISLYERLENEHPSARLARSGATRRDYIVRGIAKGVEPFARFERARADYRTLGVKAATAEVEAIRSTYPDFPLMDEVLLWLADRRSEDGEREKARDLYAEVAARFPGTASAGYGHAGVARISFDLGDYERAEREYEAIAGTKLLGAEFVSKSEIDRVRRHVKRARNVRWAGGLLALVALAGVATVDRKRLVPAVRRSFGKELLYVAPVLVLLVLLAPEDGRVPMTLVVGAGLAYLWALVIWAEASRAPSWRIASTVAGALGGAALLYTVLYALDLLVAVERSGGA